MQFHTKESCKGFKRRGELLCKLGAGQDGAEYRNAAKVRCNFKCKYRRFNKRIKAIRPIKDKYKEKTRNHLVSGLSFKCRSTRPIYKNR